MKNTILTKVEDKIKAYEADHHGEKPLYIILSDEEADKLIDAVKQEEGYEDHIVITEYHGAKIVKHMAVKAGDIQLSNELPETGS
jgi:hypothetical protein